MSTMTETKAAAIYATMTDPNGGDGTPIAASAAPVPPNWLNMLIQLLTSLLAGFNICPTPTPAQVQATLASPNARHRRILERSVRRALAQHGIYDPYGVKEGQVYEATLAVGAVTTVEEAAQLYTEANGRSPA